MMNNFSKVMNPHLLITNLDEIKYKDLKDTLVFHTYNDDWYKNIDCDCDEIIRERYYDVTSLIKKDVVNTDLNNKIAIPQNDQRDTWYNDLRIEDCKDGWYTCKSDDIIEYAKPQMDNDTTHTLDMEQEVITEQTGNVLLAATTELAESTVVAPRNLNLMDDLISDQLHYAPINTDREMILDTIEYTQTSTINNLITYDLPDHFITKNIKTPTALYFLQHEYFVSDMEIRFQVTATKMQTWAVMASVYYHYLDRDRPSDVTNIATMSQMAHVVVDANNRKDAKIHVPYQSFAPLQATVATSSIRPRYYFTLLIRNINPLLGGSSCGPVVLKIFCSLKNCRFYGLRQRLDPALTRRKAREIEEDKVAIPQSGILGTVAGGLNMLQSDGFKGMINKAEGLLSHFLSDRNRDRPSNPIEATRVIQTTATSMSNGVGTFGGEILRLNPSSTTPFDTDMIVDDDFFSYRKLCETWGLVGSINVPVTVGNANRLCF